VHLFERVAWTAIERVRENLRCQCFDGSWRQYSQSDQGARCRVAAGLPSAAREAEVGADSRRTNGFCKITSNFNYIW